MNTVVLGVLCALIGVQLHSADAFWKSLKSREVTANETLSGCRGFADWFKCSTNDACVHRSMVCDGVQHCGDGSDEQLGCSRPQAIECPSERPFQCSNSERCIRRDHVCDHYNDCVDGSDEQNCPTTTPRPTPTPQPTHPGCPAGFSYLPSSRKCYKLVRSPMPWTVAGRHCASQQPSAHLVFIGSVHEQTAVREMLQLQAAPQSPIWTGGEREGRIWSWKYQCENGTPGSLQIKYTKWGPNEPNDVGGSETCVALMNMSWWDGRWNDDDCAKAFAFICEVDI